MREIQKAVLVGLVVLPRGAYATSSVQARSKQTGWRRERVWLLTELATAIGCDVATATRLLSVVELAN